MNADLIYKMRTDLDLSREQFADLIGVSRGTVWLWETGGAKPSPLAIFALADKLKERRLDYGDKQKKLAEDYLGMHVSEARRILGLSYDGLAAILGCSSVECFKWEGAGKPVPFLYQKFIKFLLKKKREGKLDALR